MYLRERRFALASIGLILVGLIVAVVYLAWSPPTNQSFGAPKSRLSATPSGEFDPAAYALPNSVAGYKILAVVNSANTACVAENEKWLILQQRSPTTTDLMNRVPFAEVNQEAERLGIAEYTKGGVAWADPSMSAEQVQSELTAWNQSFQQLGYCVHSSQVEPVQP